MSSKCAGARRLMDARREAFTLIEVLVVVAIIALLLSILLPSLAHAREMARTTVCMSGEKQLGNSMVMYSSDQKGVLPGPIHLLLYQNSASLQQKSTATSLYYEVNMPAYLTRYIGEKSRNAKLLDKVASCPTASGIPVADDSTNTNWVYRLKSHMIANTGTAGVNAQGERTTFETRGVYPYYITKTPNYFGYTNVPLARGTLANWATRPNKQEQLLNVPKKIDSVNFAGREWAMADLWFCTKQAPRKQPRPGGTWPYDVANSNSGSVAIGGKPKVPTYPYHGRVGSVAAITQDASTSSRWKSGMTNAVFFDGHAESVRDWKGSGNPCFDANGDKQCD